jgi:hypothetical protein
LNDNTILFPPYGSINDHFLDTLDEHSEWPTSWISPQGSCTPISEQWSIWKEETLDIIARVLWPRFDVKTRWKGDSVQNMKSLTCIDLRLCRELHGQLEENAGGSSVTHREMFESEDPSGGQPGGMIPSYTSFPRRISEKISRIMSVSLDAKAAPAAVQLKAVLQRPRPYQTALLLGIKDYRWLRATSADSPSMVCGHCYEGGLMVGGLIERLLDEGEVLEAGQWHALQQYAVDMGDRRVMAGVHYPSDNLSSWLMIMRIANRVFVRQEVKQRLWQAISTQSMVYRAIREISNSAEGEVYGPALNELEKAAES